MKLLLSGGHLTPALALIDFCQQQSPETELVFVGRENTQSTLQQLSQEKRLVQQRNIPFIAFNSGRSGSNSLWRTLLETLKVGTSFWQACRIMISEKPSVFVSFGGYLAPPLAVAAWLFGIPIVTHEQTRVLGQSTRFVGKLAKKIALSYPIKDLPFPDSKVVLTGNPIRPSLTSKHPSQPNWLTTQLKKPLLYITGGNQGSETINMTVAQAIPELIKNWIVIHQCGGVTSARNYQAELERVRQTLPLAAQDRYVVRQWVEESELNWILRRTQLVISRAGANTVQELHYLAVPSILIPLPFSYADEQSKNAQALRKLGGALVIEQDDLTADSLIRAIAYAKSKQDYFHENLKQHPPKRAIEASAKLFELVRSVAPS